MILEPGDPVVFVDRKDRQYHAVLAVGGQQNIRGQLVAHDDAIGALDGARLRGERGEHFHVVRATLVQHALMMSRHAQIVYPKDLAMLVTWADLYPGARVVEGGFGSGALSMALLRAIGPEGHLTTYELRVEAANRARKNVAALFGGPPPHHEVHIADIYEGIAERDVDRVVLDVPEPWEVVGHAAAALRPGGIFAAYVPTAVQLQRVALALEGSRAFITVESLETLLRHWHASRRSVRPKSSMIGHTGFLVFARRAAGEVHRAPREA